MNEFESNSNIAREGRHSYFAHFATSIQPLCNMAGKASFLLLRDLRLEAYIHLMTARDRQYPAANGRLYKCVYRFRCMSISMSERKCEVMRLCFKLSSRQTCPALFRRPNFCSQARVETRNKVQHLQYSFKHNSALRHVLSPTPNRRPDICAYHLRLHTNFSSCLSAVRRLRSWSSKKVWQLISSDCCHMLTFTRHRPVARAWTDRLEYQRMLSSPVHNQEHTRTLRR